MESTNQKVMSTVPNKAFDLEYSTQFKKEVAYLHEHGIEPTFVKKTKDYNIPTYKYKKTPELFRTVADFYEFQRNAKQYEVMDHIIEFAKEFSELLAPVGSYHIFGCQPDGVMLGA